MKDIDDLTKEIFIELLRDFHAGVGVTHSAQPPIEVAHHLAKDAYFMAIEYQRTIEELSK